MFKFFTGDLLGIHNRISDIAEENKLPIRYTIDIASELKRMHMSLFYKPALVYFIVDDEFIKSDEAITAINKELKSKQTIVGIVETIDKRSKFYKSFKNQIETIAMPKLPLVAEFKKLGITDGNTIATTISMLKGITNKDTIGKADILAYAESFSDKTYQPSMDYKDIQGYISYKNTMFLNNIKEKDLITTLYTMYYILSNKNDNENHRRSYLVGDLINQVIGGKLSISNALQVLKLKY